MVPRWLRNVTRLGSPAARRAPRRKPTPGDAFRPRLELLEERVLLDADLFLTKAGSPASLAPGQLVTYTINVTNNPPPPPVAHTAADTTVTDTLPTGLNLVSASSTQGSCSTSGNAVTCNLGMLPPTATATVTILASPTSSAAGSTLTNTATATAAGDVDPDPANNTASTMTTVTAPPATAADLVVTKSGSPGTIHPGENATYTVTVTNASAANPANGVTVSDALPAGAVLVSATSTLGTCSTANGTVTCDLGTLAAAGSGTNSATLTVVVQATAPGTLTDTASATTTSGDSDTSNNQASAATTVMPFPTGTDLAVTAASSPTSAVPGEAVTYTVTVVNNGPNSAPAATLTDTLPANASLVGVSEPAGASCSLAGSTVTCDLGTLASGASETVSITVAPTAAAAGTTLTDTAQVSTSAGDNNTTNNTTTATTTVTAPAAATDLAITKAGTPNSAAPGQTVTYTITATNNGTNPASGTTLDDQLPANAMLVSANGPSGSFCSASGGVVSCDVGTVAPGASATLTVVITPTAAGTLTDTASVTTASGDSNFANNSATASTTVTAAPASATDLALTKVGSPTSAVPGQPVTYTLTVTNNGANPATGTTVTDQLPSGVTFISGSGPGGSSCGLSGDSVVCGLGTLAAGASSSVSITVTPKSTAAGTTVTDNATVTTSAGDTNLANNGALATTTVNATPATAADLAVTNIGSPTTAVLGQTVSYTITVTNNGTNPATSATLFNTLPAGMTFVSASGPSGSNCTQSGGNVTCTLGTLAAGDSATVTIMGKPTILGSLTDSAYATTSAGDTNLGNNAAKATTTVAQATSQVTLTVAPNPATVGQPVTLTATVVAGGSGSDTPTGTVSFFDDVNLLGTATLNNGTATLTVSNFTAGTHPLRAQYGGDAEFAGSNSGTVPLADNAAGATTTTLTAVPNPSVFGQLVTFTATVASAGGSVTPTGGVTFLDGNVFLGTAPLNAQGVATFGTSMLAVGTHAISAVYSGDSTFGTSTGTATQQVVSPSSNNTICSPNQMWIAQVYRDLLAREIDPNGLTFWTDRLNQEETRTQVVLEIETSVEYRTLLVQQMYQNLLHRPADPLSTAFWVDFLGQGAGDPTLGGPSQRMEALVLASPEYFNNRGGGINAGWVAAVYQDVLLRAALPGEVQTWVLALAGTATRLDVATAILSSPEADAVQVHVQYQRFLRRDADPAGLTFWVSALQNGLTREQLTANLVGSPEYYFLVDANVFQVYVSQLYTDLLHRPADPAGISFYVSALAQGATPLQVATVFVTSQEYRTLLVQQQYQTYLHRAADPAGLTYYVGALNAGATVEQVDTVITASDEYFQSRSGGTNEGFLNALYMDALNRPIDSVTLALLAPQLATGQTTRTQVAAGVFASDEYRLGLIRGDYQEFLGRAPTSAESSFWLNLLRQGGRDEQIVAGLVSTDEYFCRLP